MIQFIYGWNQYLWPLLITTRDDMQTIVIGIKKMIVDRRRADRMAASSWRPRCWPCCRRSLVVVLMQRWFVKGLVETEK